MCVFWYRYLFVYSNEIIFAEENKQSYKVAPLLYFMITNIYNELFILFLFSDNQSNFLYFQAALQLSIFYRYRVGVTVQSWQIWKNLAIFGCSAQVVKLKILTSLSHLIQMSKINWGRSLGKLFSIFSNMNSMWRQM